jgi:hypothetical protein
MDDLVEYNYNPVKLTTLTQHCATAIYYSVLGSPNDPWLLHAYHSTVDCIISRKVFTIKRAGEPHLVRLTGTQVSP